MKSFRASYENCSRTAQDDLFDSYQVSIQSSNAYTYALDPNCDIMDVTSEETSG